MSQAQKAEGKPEGRREGGRKLYTPKSQFEDMYRLHRALLRDDCPFLSRSFPPHTSRGPPRPRLSEAEWPRVGESGLAPDL